MVKVDVPVSWAALQLGGLRGKRGKQVLKNRTSVLIYLVHSMLMNNTKIFPISSFLQSPVVLLMFHSYSQTDDGALGMGAPSSVFANIWDKELCSPSSAHHKHIFHIVGTDGDYIFKRGCFGPVFLLHTPILHPYHFSMGAAKVVATAKKAKCSPKIGQATHPNYKVTKRKASMRPSKKYLKALQRPVPPPGRGPPVQIRVNGLVNVENCPDYLLVA